MKRLITLVLIAIASISAEASHLYGGEIWWECQSNGQYVFYARIYRDCTGIPWNPTSANLQTNHPIGSITCTIQPGYPKDVSPGVGNGCGTSQITCAGQDEGSISEYFFKSNPVTLNGVPPSAGWYFAWTSCNRPAMTNLQGFPCYYLRAWMFPYNDGTGNRNANPCFDSSPEFLEAPKVTTCAGYPFSYNNFAFDPELDSLYFDWAQPLNNGLNNPVTFNAPYSFNNPVPGITNFAQNAGQVDINTSLTGKYATCMKVTAYKYGQKVAEIFRDIPIILLGCTGPLNDPPTLDVINDPLPAPQLTPVLQSGDTLYYEMTVNAGDSIYFRLQSQDDDVLPPTFIPQQITFIGVGGNLGQPLNNPSTCLFNPPCATIQPIAPQSSFVSSLTNNVEFSWKTDCNHLSFNPIAGGAARSQYLFYFKMEDSYCPAPSFKLITARINVVSPAPVPPDLSNSCLAYDPITDEVTLPFVGPTAADTAQNFDYYVVFRGDSAGNFSPYDTINDFAAVNYIDVNPDRSERYYYMKTFGGCGQESFSSDTLSIINLKMTPFPVASPFVAQLEWTDPFGDPSLGTNYEVWRQVVGSGNWQQITATQDTFFNDTVNLCEELLQYQIRLGGACGSFTAQDTFRDLNNQDQLDIAFVTNDAGQTLIEFPATNYGDVVEYHILQQVGGTWTLADVVPVGTPTPYAIPGSNPDVQVEKYKVISIDSCGNTADTTAVLTHNNILLAGDLNPCEATMRLEWNAYKNWVGEVGAYYIYADVTPPGGPTNMGVLMGTNTGDDTTFLHENLASGTGYCYYIVAEDTSGTLRSTSNDECINSSVVVRSQLQYMARATVQIDGAVEIWAFIDRNADVDEYQVQRSEDEFGPWITVGVVPKPTAAPYQVKYTDFGANTESARYFYRIRSETSCGTVDTVSNYGTNILLNVTPNDNLTNQLDWSDYETYGGNTTYSVFRKQKNAGNWVEVETGITESEYTDNIRQFGNGNGIFCYYVTAVESNNPLGFVDENGGPMTSKSNEVCADHDSRGFYPSAFNPNSAIPSNRVWSPQMLFEESSSYSIVIVDRWGNEVFNSVDPLEGWDGTFRGEDSPEGVYFFIVRYRSEEGKMKEDRGSITLLR
ncbi:T9SS type B sorting domain-containing protein [Phaeocystidibacter luteus]|uniref:T9SS type B sorting domain-containing protein n=1 Tax=Phaeocystidibacter luteus TaxID=911197 RepID=A0A6N6RLB1_9FLAO|nr:gliding motility-associated C-terminal domain-containing protein [Phaeocystidibacter luteus]KAB2814259.1 T9SS type B sorting domain-containing protein [Phaeocystidibacter luteus]